MRMLTSGHRLVALVAAAACVAIGATACGDGGNSAGEEVYQANCATCHGADGGGGAGPKLSEGRVVERYPEVADQERVVREGVEGTAMQAWEGTLTDEEISAVVEYERSL
ncbi:MAG: hypothetical protein JJLCMIEE_02120 [Acidimicrobiales bacterium]|nr:MAG: cytochrome c [Actinomycetota bacterium]MBV6509053.1 hypothetical protein [Acidimicrobiales bacterium]RIK06238.1 MAG: hypothetical protein DCC48_07350 [Acidobacteriota bacterium]